MKIVRVSLFLIGGIMFASPPAEAQGFYLGRPTPVPLEELLAAAAANGGTV